MIFMYILIYIAGSIISYYCTHTAYYKIWEIRMKTYNKNLWNSEWATPFTIGIPILFSWIFVFFHTIHALFVKDKIFIIFKDWKDYYNTKKARNG